MSPSSSNASTLTSSLLPSRICYCSLEAILKTSFTEANFGCPFFRCVNYRYDKLCGYFSWYDPEMCHHGKRVLRRLQDRHEKINEKAARVESQSEKDSGKCTAIMDVEHEKQQLEMETLKIKVETLERQQEQHRLEVETLKIKVETLEGQQEHHRLEVETLIRSLSLYKGNIRGLC
ncbi:hypothetical protein CJ030_MR8G027518 [Morella rubra]|uniref:GRF-type domain-containing protein n=1 Tax=Morella rubra TaxID=262757 RepID=A0A6A1USD0_9ROSI|nr:hypothetical protein CJ030_MR8G027518 [Morella rubra]